MSGAPLVGSMPGDQGWAPGSRPLRLVNGAATVLIIGGVVARLSWAGLPPAALRLEVALIAVGAVYAVPAVLLRAGRFSSVLWLQVALMAVNTALAVAMLAVAAPYLPDFLPFAAFVLASLTLNFDLGFGPRGLLAVSAIPGAGLLGLMLYYLAAFHAPVGPALVWVALLAGVILLGYVTLRILEGRAGRARRQAESLLRSIGDMGEGIVVTEGGRLVACNEAYIQMTGYDRDELFALDTLLRLSPAGEREQLAEQLATRLAGGGVPFHYQASLVRKDGVLIAVENSVRFLEGDPGGHLVAIVRDVSARRRAEALRAARFAVARAIAQAETWEAAEPAVLDALCRELGWTRAEYREAGAPAAPAEGALAEIAFPVTSGAEAVGEIALYSDGPQVIDAALREELAELGSLIGESSERKRAESALRQSERRMRVVLENVGEGILTIDRTGVIASANPAVRRLFGYSPDALIGKRAQMLVQGEHAKDFLAYLGRRVGRGAAGAADAHETIGRRSDGTNFPMDLLIGDMRDSEGGLFVVSLRDVTERRAHIEALEYKALHDPLTGLPNRTLFSDRLSQALQLAARDRLGFAVLVLDLNNFKEINDALGHAAGDRLLAEAADRLRAACRASDTVARLGGDEFAVLMSPTGGGSNSRTLARKVLTALEPPFLYDEREIEVRASIGIAEYPDHGEDPGTLIRHADAAMYAAKRAREGFGVYSADHERAAAQRVLMMGQLRDAVAGGYLDLLYQPVVDLKTGRPVLVEALVRWAHPEDGLLTPDRFIPLAEESGSIGELTRWVAENALADLRRWLDEGLEIGLSLNISAGELRKGGFSAWIARVLAELRLPPSLLTLELAEGQLAAAGPALGAKELWRQGVGLAIDDFGVGYSSLSYLTRLPVTQLKVDRSFVEGLTLDTDAPAIVRSAIELGHGLGLKVVAEGVEDEATRQVLLAYGCDLSQGFLISRPLRRQAVGGWIRSVGTQAASPPKRARRSPSKAR